MHAIDCSKTNLFGIVKFSILKILYVCPSLKNWRQRIAISCCNVIALLEELKTAIQCLGIKPKAINE